MSQKPRVLRIINRFNLGGPTYNAANLTKYLEDDFETLLIGGQKMESEESSFHITDALNIQPKIIQAMSRSVSPLDDLKALREISKIIKAYQPDIVHTHASKAGALGRLAAKLNGVDVVVHTFHGHVFEHYFGPLKSKAIVESERFLAKLSSCVIAISEKQRSELVDRYKIAAPEKIKTIPLGFDLGRFSTQTEEKRKVFRAKFNLQNHEVAIGIIGRLVPIKDHLTFLKALGELKKREIPFKALIIGDGELRSSLEKELQPHGLSEQEVQFTSWIYNIDEAIAGLDIIALSSLSEGTPVSLIEAQAGGKPIVSTNVGGVEDIMLADQSGFLAAPSDYQTFAKHLEKLIEDDALRSQMGQMGKGFSHEKFSAKRLASDMKKLYIDLLNH